MYRSPALVVEPSLVVLGIAITPPALSYPSKAHLVNALPLTDPGSIYDLLLMGNIYNICLRSRTRIV